MDRPEMATQVATWIPSEGKKLVGVDGFEPPTSCSQSRRATGLRYAPVGIFGDIRTFYRLSVHACGTLAAPGGGFAGAVRVADAHDWEAFAALVS